MTAPAAAVFSVAYDDSSEDAWESIEDHQLKQENKLKLNYPPVTSFARKRVDSAVSLDLLLKENSPKY